MALSPQYSWPEPDNSSLVKNGAQDIRALGDAIDTSVWNVGYGQAGKNKIINGDFRNWQRGTSFTINSTNLYTADRFFASYSTAAPTTYTVSQQTFAPGELPGNAAEGVYFLRSALTSIGTATNVRIEQRIEDVKTFAGTTITVSFYAKADAPRVLTVMGIQYFAGGSASVDIASQTVNLTTSWARYSLTFAIPSISGKTIGITGGGALGIRFSHPASNSTIDLWGVQAEYGSKATPFQTASGGSIQGELAMCQRYYVRFDNASVNAIHGIGLAYDTTNTYFSNQLPVTMRTAPSAIDFSVLRVSDGVSATNITTASIALSDRNQPLLQFVVASGLTAFRPYLLQQQSTSGYYGLSAEL
jgi:hypothetical protein